MSMSTNWHHDKEFDRLWRELAEIGRCDSLGSMEYRRVFAEWIDAGRPEPIVPFIVTRANATVGD